MPAASSHDASRDAATAGTCFFTEINKSSSRGGIDPGLRSHCVRSPLGARLFSYKRGPGGGEGGLVRVQPFVRERGPHRPGGDSSGRPRRGGRGGKAGLLKRAPGHLATSTPPPPPRAPPAPRGLPPPPRRPWPAPTSPRPRPRDGSSAPPPHPPMTQEARPGPGTQQPDPPPAPRAGQAPAYLVQADAAPADARAPTRSRQRLLFPSIIS